MIPHLEERTKIKCASKQSTDENNDMTWIIAPEESWFDFRQG